MQGEDNRAQKDAEEYKVLWHTQLISQLYLSVPMEINAAVFIIFSVILFTDSQNVFK